MGGTEITRDRFRGLGIPYPLVLADLVDSTPSGSTPFDEASPTPDVARPGRSSKMRVHASGQLEAAGDEVTLTAHPGGYPTPDHAGFLYEINGGPLCGCDTPNVIAHHEWVQRGTNSLASGLGSTHPHIVTLSNGKMVMAATSIVTTVPDVLVWTYDPDLRQWQAKGSIYKDVKITGARQHVCLEVLPNDAVLLYHFVFDVAQDLAQVAAQISLDGGETWNPYADRILDDPIDLTVEKPRRIRVRDNRLGQSLMVIWTTLVSTVTTQEGLWSLASDDDGITFRTVSKWAAATEDGAFPDLVVSGGAFLLAYIAGQNATDPGRLHVIRLTNAFSPIAYDVNQQVKPNNGNPLTEACYEIDAGTTKHVVDGDLALAVDDDEVLYLFARYAKNETGGIVCRSVDYGKTWKAIGQGSPVGTSDNLGTWYHYGDLDRSPANFAVAFQRGRAVMVANHKSLSGSYDSSVSAIYLGGFTSATMPQLDKFRRATRQVGFHLNWLPYDVPWAVATTHGFDTATLVTGSPTASTATGRLALNGVSTERWLADAYAITGTPTEGGIVVAEVEAVQGTANVLFRTRDGSVGYGVDVRVTSTSISVYDINGASIIGSSYTHSFDVVRLRVDMRGSKVYVQACEADSHELREWIEVAVSSSLTSSTTGTAYVSFGFDTATATTEVYWDAFNFIETADVGEMGYEDGNDPSDLMWRGASYYSVSFPGGLRARTPDGPSRLDDTWVVSAKSSFGIQNILPTVRPSPRTVWRSGSVPQDMRIPFQLDDNGEDVELGSPAIAVPILNTNVPRVKLRGLTGGAWADLVDAKLYVEVAFVRHGNTVVPATSGSSAAARYIQRASLVGGHFEFPSSTVHAIARNSEGFWDDGAVDEKRPTLWLEGIAGTEPTSGTAKLWFPNALIVWHNTSETKYEALALELNPGGLESDPPEGYYQIGSAAPCPISVWGKDPKDSRRRGVKDNVELTTLRDGTRRSRRNGPHRRSFKASFADPVDIRLVQQETTDTDFVRLHSSGDPIASRHDAPLLLEGVYDEVGGRHGLVLYLPYLEQLSASDVDQVELFGRARGASFCRLMPGVSIETVLGDEEYDELTRVATITLEVEG